MTTTMEKRKNVAGNKPKAVKLIKEALQHVVLPREHKKKRPYAPKDHVGEYTTKALNSNPMFVYQDDDSDKKGCGAKFSPLLSRKSVSSYWKLLHGFNDLNDADFRRIIASVNAKFHNMINFSQIYSAGLVFSWLAVVFSGLMLVSSHVTIVWSSRVMYMLMINILFLLVDMNDLRQSCPPTLVHLWKSALAVGEWIDALVLMGKRFVGREWNGDDFEWKDPLISRSRNSDLWNLPPPTVREGRRLCLNEKYIARPEWSRDTTQHVVALNFCYIMMRDDFVRRQARRNKELRSQDSEDPKPATRSNDDTSVDQIISIRNSQAEQMEYVYGLSATTPAEGTELVRKSDHDGAKHNPDSSSGYLNSPTSPNDSIASCSSDAAADMNWIDLGAKIGIRLLSSSHLQQAVASQDAIDRIKDISDKLQHSNTGKNNREPKTSNDIASVTEVSATASTSRSDAMRSCISPKSPTRPMHSMWTSAAAAGASTNNSPSSNSDWDDQTSPIREFSQPPEIVRSRLRPISPDDKPPLSPRGSPQRGKNSKSSSTAVMSDVLDRYESLSKDHLPEKNVRSQVVHRAVSGASNRSTRNPNERVVSKTIDGPFLKENNHVEKKLYRRLPLEPGVKVAAPMCPIQPYRKRLGYPKSRSDFQLATVVSSQRIFVGNSERSKSDPDFTNCLSVTCKLDKCFLRNGEFADLTFRVMDEWSPRYMPKHSKMPLGSCVKTAFGIGVLVSWRVEDDCHVVRSLWQRRGPGTAHAYLTREAILSKVPAAVGFDVATTCGSGKVLGHVDGSKDEIGRFLVAIRDDGKHKSCVLHLNPEDILSCHGAQFIPVIEHIKEAANYQIQVDNYKAAVREQRFSDEEDTEDDQLWKNWSEGFEILWESFLKAVNEDSEFDEGVNHFMSSLITFLEHLDRPSEVHEKKDVSPFIDEPPVAVEDEDDLSSLDSSCNNSKSEGPEEAMDPGFWIMNDFLGGIFNLPDCKVKDNDGIEIVATRGDKAHEQTVIMKGFKMEHELNEKNYKSALAVIRTLMKAVSYARVSGANRPNFKIAMAICHEFLMFIRTLLKVHQKNFSPQSMEVWKRALDEIVSTFGPIQERLEKIGQGIAQRMEQQGRKAKIKVLRFVDYVLQDEIFIKYMCQGEWENCVARIEFAMIKSKIIDETSHEHYRKAGMFIYEHIVLLSSNGGSAAARNNEKLANFAQVLQWMASPKRSLLKLLCHDEVLEILERILVRVFCREKVASRMLAIHASNFHSLRHLRILKNLSVSGRLWIPLLDAADEEFNWVVPRMPDNAKGFMSPLSSIFSLCVAQFHKIIEGDLSKDWLDFLLEEDAVRIIHDIDMRLILALESFSHDVKEMLVVLPYYPSIDDDILNLIDEVQLDQFLKEASDAIDDTDKLAQFIREKATVAIERFLGYLPKMSIPVERREMGDGWVLTCHGENGGDLTLSDVKVRRENMVCEVMGGDALFLPLFGEDEGDISDNSSTNSTTYQLPAEERVEVSILDQIRELLLQAQHYGCWKVGVGGVGQPPTDQYIASVLHGLPVTSVLNCAIELWRNLEIDDDELLEIAIRDVSFQIQLQKKMEEKANASSESNDGEAEKPLNGDVEPSSCSRLHKPSSTRSFESVRRRFNPRIDPTVLFFEMKNVTFHLDQFRFRIEKDEAKTVFDPVFEGYGTVSIQNVSILIRIECARERLKRGATDVSTPILLLRELDVQLEKVRLKVKDTGADWLLNKVVKGFQDNITSVVEANLKEQVREQSKLVLDHLNSYFLVHPDLLLGLLGITMDDLEEHVVWV